MPTFPRAVPGMILISALCLSPIARAAGNLLGNAGFENAAGPTVVGWRCSSGAAMRVLADPGQARSGNRCLRFEPGGEASAIQFYGASWEGGETVFPGKRQRYLVTAFARGEGARLSLRLLCYGERIPKDAKRPEAAVFPVTSDWRRYDAAFTVPEGTTNLGVVVGRAGGAGTIDLDDAGLYDAREADVRFLASRDELLVRPDGRWLRRERGIPAAEPLSAEIRVHAASNASRPVLRGDLREMKDDGGFWRASTAALPEGGYTVRVRIAARSGETLGEYEDWFERRVFDWMKRQRGYGDDVPAPYTALATTARTVEPWGRRYGLAETGLPTAFVSQGRDLLSGPMVLEGTVGGAPVAWTTRAAFRFGAAGPRKAAGRSVLEGGGVRVRLEAETAYDGLLVYRMSYGPTGKSVRLERLRWRIPLKAAHCLFYSSDGTPSAWVGDEILASPGRYNHDLLPAGQGKVFDGLAHPQTFQLTPNFTGLLWLADHDVCFCYAADDDRGWIHRDEAAAVEAFRTGGTVEVVLNVVNRPVDLTAERTAEFSFQAGPTKPLPKGWRGIQYEGNPDDAPLTVHLAAGSGGGRTLAGATHFMHPGLTEERVRASREKIAAELAGSAGRIALAGYHFWGRIVKGFPETRVFRTEWKIDKERWENAVERTADLKSGLFGGDKDMCTLLMVAKDVVPSYVDFTTHAYDECLKQTAISGFYDDTGYPKPVFDGDLGVGYADESGTGIVSSGLWVYRDRWERAAYLNHRYGRPNFLMDSQHVRAHYLPAYNFIGLWAPCEHGYYNTLKEGDNYDFYGSLERYAAFNPARQFGQIPMVGMGSSRAAEIVHDTRSMMMLALLHDQDVGSFGRRDLRTVCRLRHARNRIRPWDDEVSFTGYWESANLVKTGSPAVRASLYRRPGEALMIAGNTGRTAANAALAPDWRTLGIDPAAARAFDAETGAALRISGGTVAVTIPSHEPRLVYVGGKGGFEADVLTSAGLVPDGVLGEHSDTLAGPALAPGWISSLHEGPHASASVVDGRLRIAGHGYGYGHVRKRLGIDGVSVQCMVMNAGKVGGGLSPFSPGLFLWWGNGEWVQAAPSTTSGRFHYASSAAKAGSGSPINVKATAPWYPYYANWVKIVLLPDRVVFCGSSDGKTWNRDMEIPRGERLAGAPEWVVLGRGSAGEKPFLANPHPQHFNPNGEGQAFFSDLVVARSSADARGGK